MLPAAADRAALPAVGFALALAIVVVALLALLERIGLPPALAEAFLGVAGLLLLVGILPFATTGRTTGFLAAFAGLPAGALAAILVGLLAALLLQATPTSLPAVLAWLVSGPLAAGILLIAAGRNGPERAEAITATDHARVTLGLAGALPLLAGFALAGVALLALGLAALAPALTAATGLGPLPLAVLQVLLVALPFLLGGARGLATGLLLLVALAAGSLITPMLAASRSLGPLPLPGVTGAAALQQLAEVHRVWFAGLAVPPVLAGLPPLGLALSPAVLGAAAGLAGVLAVIIAGLAAPAASLPAERRRAWAIRWLLWTGFGTLLVLGALLALAAYGLEAAGLGFVGASTTRPPAALLEAVRTGIVQVCGTADPAAVVAACRAAGKSTLGWGDVRPGGAFALAGLGVALGLPASTAQLPRLLPPLLGLGLAQAGLALLAVALAHDGLYRTLHPAGLASWRLAVARLLALCAAAAVALAQARGLLPAPRLWLVSLLLAPLLVLPGLLLARWRRATGGITLVATLAGVGALLWLWQRQAPLAALAQAEPLLLAALVAQALAVALLVGALLALAVGRLPDQPLPGLPVARVYPARVLPAYLQQAGAAPEAPDAEGDIAQHEAGQQPQEGALPPALHGRHQQPGEQEAAVEVDEADHAPGVAGNQREALPEVGGGGGPGDGDGQRQRDEREGQRQQPARPPGG